MCCEFISMERIEKKWNDRTENESFIRTMLENYTQKQKQKKM